MTPSSFVAVMAALESITRPLLANGRIVRRGHLREHVELRVEGVERPVLLERDVAGDAATAEGQWNILNVLHLDNNYFPITLVTYVTASVAPLSVDSVVLSNSDDFNEDICHMSTIKCRPFEYDCHHDRVVLHGLEENQLLVWDPLTCRYDIIHAPMAFFTSEACDASVICGCDGGTGLDDRTPTSCWTR
ncbi:hypothetical protein GUJ93_ZPchr0010g8279 [Zizania palustris]|uniref:Uncharacterized protein n=1 Tax=Zizania palustris TaxID=103762 RepID=A0A8J5WDK5_ZIZPA|nr:hypothetical protein GUJ93_ZPchr0010g8279 [Zizania palustris]